MNFTITNYSAIVTVFVLGLYIAFALPIITTKNALSTPNISMKTNVLLTKSSPIRPKRNRQPKHVLRVRIRVDTIDNALIETLINQKQLEIIEKQLKYHHIPFQQVKDNKDGITIIVGPLHKTNQQQGIQSQFHANFSTIIPQKMLFPHSENDRTFQHGFPFRIEAQEYDLAIDKESYEFRNCLESCEYVDGKELKPNHNCIRKKCLKEITGI